MPDDTIFVERFSLGGDGPTAAMKDCIDIAGHRTSAGSEAWADRPPATAHARIVDAVLASGARIVGKTNMHELAFGLSGINRWLGTPPNPLFPALIPGGSSSGSAAAVAAGEAQIAIGTDTGGSIRMPAACCGIFGLKPTFGRVSREGLTPARSSLDCAGPFARDMAGIEQGMRLIDPGFSDVPPLATVRVGMVATDADPAVAAIVADSLAASEATLIEVDLPGLLAAFEAGATIIAAECWSAFAELTGDPRLGEDVRARLLAAASITGAQLAAAEQVRADFTRAVDAALETVDVLAMPTLPTLPPALDELGDPRQLLRLTTLVRPFNLSGHPALTMPVGQVAGRPVSLQLVAGKGADERLCAAGRRLAGAAGAGR